MIGLAVQGVVVLTTIELPGVRDDPKPVGDIGSPRGHRARVHRRLHRAVRGHLAGAAGGGRRGGPAGQARHPRGGRAMSGGGGVPLVLYLALSGRPVPARAAGRDDPPQPAAAAAGRRAAAELGQRRPGRLQPLLGRHRRADLRPGRDGGRGRRGRDRPRPGRRRVPPAPGPRRRPDDLASRARATRADRRPRLDRPRAAPARVRRAVAVAARAGPPHHPRDGRRAAGDRLRPDGRDLRAPAGARRRATAWRSPASGPGSSPAT